VDPREIDYERRRWMGQAQDRVPWRALVLAVLKRRVHVPEILLNTAE
jgi:hypothetical protein